MMEPVNGTTLSTTATTTPWCPPSTLERLSKPFRDDSLDSYASAAGGTWKQSTSVVSSRGGKLREATRDQLPSTSPRSESASCRPPHGIYSEPIADKGTYSYSSLASKPQSTRRQGHFQRRALRLASVTPHGALRVYPEAIRVVQAMSQPLSVVAVWGSPGKTAVLNELLTVKSNGFPSRCSSAKDNEQTLWVWGQPVNLSSAERTAYAVVIACDDGADFKTQGGHALLCLLFSLCSVFVPIFSIDDSEQAALDLLQRVSKANIVTEPVPMVWIATQDPSATPHKPSLSKVFLERGLSKTLLDEGRGFFSFCEVVTVPPAGASGYAPCMRDAARSLFSIVAQHFKHAPPANMVPLSGPGLAQLLLEKESQSMDASEAKDDRKEPVMYHHTKLEPSVIPEESKDRTEAMPQNSSSFASPRCARRSPRPTLTDALRRYENALSETLRDQRLPLRDDVLRQTFLDACSRVLGKDKLYVGSVPLPSFDNREFFNVMTKKWIDLVFQNQEARRAQSLEIFELALDRSLKRIGSQDSIAAIIQSITAALPDDHDSATALAQEALLRARGATQHVQRNADAVPHLRAELAQLRAYLEELHEDLAKANAAPPEGLPPRSGAEATPKCCDKESSDATGVSPPVKQRCLPAFRGNGVLVEKLDKVLKDLKFLKGTDTSRGDGTHVVEHNAQAQSEAMAKLSAELEDEKRLNKQLHRSVDMQRRSYDESQRFLISQEERVSLQEAVAKLNVKLECKERDMQLVARIVREVPLGGQGLEETLRSIATADHGASSPFTDRPVATVLQQHDCVVSPSPAHPLQPVNVASPAEKTLSEVKRKKKTKSKEDTLL